MRWRREARAHDRQRRLARAPRTWHLGRRGWLCALLLWGAACSTSSPDVEPAASVDVEFAGADSLYDFRLRRVIADPLLDFERAPRDEAPLFDAAQDLQDYYLTLGFPDARVTYRLQHGPRPRVVFTVQEGPCVTVARMQLTGNETFADDELLPLWPRTRSGLLATGDPYYVAEELAVFRSAMRAFYGQRGFLEARIDGPHVEREPEATTAHVRFVIWEGPRYRVDRVDIAPSLPLQAEKLDVARVLGKPYERDALEMLRQRARVRLESDGHPAPHVELRLDRDAATHTVHARLDGAPGPRARVVAVAVEGNVRTVRAVIERSIRFAPGEWYDGSKVEATTREAYLTGLFRRVEVERRPRNADGTELELVVVVDEVESFDVDLLAGYGSYEGLRGGVSLTDRNLFGRGHRASIGMRASNKGQALTASWTVPNALATGTSLTTTAHLREREEPTFVDKSRGFAVALQRDLVGSLRGRVGYELQARNSDETDPAVIGTAPDSYELGSVFAELVLDERDSPLYPSRGHRESVKFESARTALGSDIELDRVTWSLAGFHTLAEDVVIGATARAGIAWSNAELPVQERFFNGGESSVRSFEESELGPLSPTGTPVGGAFFNTLSVELRFPVLRSLHGAVFGDAGNVGRFAEAFGFSDLRYGIGGGLRLVLPIGPIRLDGAVNPDRRPGEETWVLHLSVGLPF